MAGAGFRDLMTDEHVNKAEDLEIQSRTPHAVPRTLIRRSRTIWFAYLLLLVVSIPWYFPNGNGEPLVLGFPLWCFVSLTCCVAAALLTAWQLDAVWEETERYGEQR